MLSPDVRTVAVDALRPPPGYRLDRAVLTTYTLDLEVLLALPLAVLAQIEGGVEDLIEQPLLLLEALREAGDRVHVFVDETGIAPPRGHRPLYAALEESIHPVRAPNGGVFHPKGWFVRFVDEEGASLLRIAVASRNLTFDRCWDIALISEAVPAKRKLRASRDLGSMLRALPTLSDRALDPELEAALDDMAGQVERTAFPAPEGFDGPVRFHALGLGPIRSRPWRPWNSGRRVLAMAPFMGRTVLDALAANAAGPCDLIGRREELDRLPEKALEPWNEVFVLSDAAEDEPGDDLGGRPSGLHAKLMAMEEGAEVTWLVGSPNLTSAAYQGRNVELAAEVTGLRRKFGIQSFHDAGFLRLCERYRRRDCAEEVDGQIERARELLEDAQRQLLDADLQLVCRPDEEGYRLIVDGGVSLPEPVQAWVWPVSIAEDQAKSLAQPPAWHLPVARLTTLLAIRLQVDAAIDDVRFVLKLPASGLPAGRVAQVLRTLIDTPEKFLQFLRALLGGIEEVADIPLPNSQENEAARWGMGLYAETLLEDLVRVASRDPERLEPVRDLIEDLRASSEGREIVPDNLYRLWQVVDTAVSEGAKR